MHLSVEISEFSAWMRSWGAAEATIEARLSLLRNLSADLNILTATADQLATWLGNPAFQPWTRVTYFSNMRCLFEWLHRTGQRLDDPTEGMRRPKEPRRKPRPLTPNEVVRILSAAQGHERTWVSLGLFAGLRAFEIAKFRGEDINEAELFVRGKGGKDAVLPTHPALWHLAQSYPRTGWWFPTNSATGHINPKTLTTKMTRLFASLDIQGSTHRARHTYGTNLLRGGANIRVVQELMRHESLATTAGYLRVEEAERVTAIGSLSA
jgi:site-specific recombinase XerD